MKELIEYASILLYGNVDFEELENHLSANGYDFGIATNRNLLFVVIDEVDYVENILADRNITYVVREY
ncbi:MAG: hypothetical protein J6S14_15520 [Clostridia bacterium]|nr:hypothetical protein [Clostridia bacterium]